MPNWACGTVSITGPKQNILKFADRFIYNEQADSDNKPEHRFFARSFSSYTQAGMTDEIEALFADTKPGTEATFSLPIDFAWSAYSCLIKGYPQDFAEECITLSDACKLDGVSVEIQTDEPGMCFEETITCDKDGNIDAQSCEMPAYTCPHCDATHAYPSFVGLDESACYECGEIGLTKPEVD